MKIELVDTGSSAGLTVHDLLIPGLRRNPRRAHLLVSTVLGKHIPTDPAQVRRGADLLGDLVLDALGTKDAAVLGFAETATGLGHGVAARMQAHWYLHSTRRVGAPEFASFEEGHSHATNHLLQPSAPDLFDGDHPLVLVDDEYSTGRTVVDAIRSLHRIAPREHYVMAALVDMRTDEHQAEVEAAMAELGARIDSVSLATGRVILPDGLLDWVQGLPDPVLNPVAAVAGSVSRVELPWPADVPEGGRHGFSADDQAGFDAAVSDAADVLVSRLDPDRPVIVIGHEELMYLPLCLAENLAARSIPVRYQTTTRSPAYVLDKEGYPLRRGFQFEAPELGEAAPRFLYNAQWEGAQIVLVIDQPADTPRLQSLLTVLADAGERVLVAVVSRRL